MTGQSQWHILTTKAQREFRAETALAPICVEVIVPKEWKLVDSRKNQPAKYRLQAAERPVRAYPLFPRYLFIHTHGTPPWHAIRSLEGTDGLRLITGVLSVDGSPHAIKVDPLTRLRLMTIVAPTITTIPVAPSFAPGERVRVVDGPFAGMVFTVRGKQNKTHYQVLSDTFASMKEIALPTTTLERVAA